MFKKLLFMMLALFLSASVYAQSGSITGEVTDAETGEALIGATVYIQALQKGTQTNIDGEYTITNVPSGTYNVSITYVGYRDFSAEVQVGSGSVTLDAQLNVDLVGLDEVVVTGFGSIDRQAFTGTVSSVSSENLESVPVASVDAALQGQAAGVVIMAPSGTPGSTQSIRIRGTSSINAGTSPLFVIDGVPVVGGSFGGAGTSSLGVLSNINSSDIESITVLKDAASTAPYGARGTNGVIVITTKQGKEGATTYSFSAQRGTNNQAADGKDALNAAQWDELYVEAVNNAFGAGTVTSSPWDGETDTNWGEVTRNQEAVQQEYTLSARGGNGTTNFYASAGFFDQEGFVYGSALDRLSGKFDVSHQFDERVRIQNSFTGSFVEQDGLLEGAGYFGSPILAKFFMIPGNSPYNADGTPATSYDIPQAIFNPVYIRENTIDVRRNSRVVNNTNLNIKLIENLTFNTRFAIDYLIGEEKSYDDPFYGDAASVGGRVSDQADRNFNYVWQNTLTYLWMPDVDHSFNIKAITESQRNYSRDLFAYGEGFAAPGLYNVSTTGGVRDAGSSTSDWAVQSFTGLVNYGFQNKLYFDGSIRYEGSSRFGPENRWGTFWSGGLGYVITEEEFMQDLNWLDFLKFRISYGKTGNSSVGLNSYQATVGFGSYNNQANILTNQLGNRDLTWETANSLDIGMEFEVFSRVSGGVTVYNKTSRDLLFGVPLSRTTGHSSQTRNIGELYNRGIEAELNVDVVRTRDFKWNLGGNFSAQKNEVTKLPVDGNGEPITIQSTLLYTAVEGYPVSSWFSREWAGVDPDNGNPLWYMDDGNGGRTTTSNINDADFYDQNATRLPTMFGGINTRIDVKSFYLTANMYYSFGNKIYDNWAFYMKSDGQFITAFGQYAEQYDRWQEPGDIAKNPRNVFGGNNNSNSSSSRFLYDGDYLRLRTLNVGYNVPARYLQNTGLKGASVYFLGQNLWTYAFDKDLGFDPEQGVGSVAGLNVPPLQSLTFGVKVNF